MGGTVQGDIKALLDHASAPGRLRASCAQLQGSHPLEPGIAFNNLLGLVRQNYSNLTAINLSSTVSRACCIRTAAPAAGPTADAMG
jgi:hypothetical protein